MATSPERGSSADRQPTVGELRARIRRRLARSPHDIDPREASLLLGQVLGMSEIQVLTRDDLALDPEQVQAVESLVSLRATGRPFAYLAGRREFYGREFSVDSRVLIPRPETEHLVEACLALDPPPRQVLDIGVGSGCIALTLALERRDARVVGVDLSPAALAVAHRNRHRLSGQDPSLPRRVLLCAGDLLSAVDPRSFDTVVSNPPYIPRGHPLPATVVDHEPPLALIAGDDGLAVHRSLLGAGTLLVSGQRLVLEIGAGQGESVRRLATPRFELQRVVHDLAGIERALVLVRRQPRGRRERDPLESGPTAKPVTGAAASPHMESFLIQGPTRLEGVLAASGAKNAALPALAACLLGQETVVLENVPAVQDTRTMGRVLEHLGASVRTEVSESGALRTEVDGSRLGGEPNAPYELVKTMRASVLVLGPLLARFGRARVSLPGGCAIGARPIDQHLAGLRAMGADIELEHGYVEARARHLRACTFRFDLPTVTGTENLMMAATLARGTTVLENCAREPEVAELAELLSAMGAAIEGAGTDTIRIEGRDGLGSSRHRVMGDRIEAGTYLVGAAITGGDVTVEGVRSADLRPLAEKLSACGVEVTWGDDWMRTVATGPPRPQDLETAPYPGFATDLQAQFLALMTQAEGSSRITEAVFENRFQHVPELNRMGADIVASGRTATVRGPSRLTGATVMATDLRASACLVLAGLAAVGETRVDRIYHLDRGYQTMESKLQKLGAIVARTSGRPE